MANAGADAGAHPRPTGVERIRKLTCEETKAFEWLQTNGNGLLLLADVPGVIAKVSIVPMSDH